MSIESNKEIIHRHIRAVNDKTPEVWDEIMSPDFSISNVTANREGYAQILKQMWTAFPDLNVTIHDMVAEGDKVVIRYTERGTQRADIFGIPTKGKCYEKGGFGIVPS